jgi:hypothetical protein
MARKRKTVVTPVVVEQAGPPRRILWVVLTAVGIILAMWFSYDYGRSLHADAEKSANATADRNPEQRIARLEQRIAKLERELQSTPRRVRDPEAIVRALSGKTSPPPKAAPIQTPTVDSTDTVASGPSDELKLTDLAIEPTDSDDRFRFSFSVVHPGNEADQVVGTIWIAVNGLSNGRPVRLSLKQVTSETRPYLDMRFTGRQGVDGELTLPPGFEPKNIAIEAKPYDKKYQGASGKFDWTAGTAG